MVDCSATLDTDPDFYIYEDEIDAYTYKNGKLSIEYRTTDKHSRLIETFRSLQASFVTEERVVGNLEEPRTELPSVTKARAGKVGLHQSVLRQVVRLVPVAAAKCEQEASECLLLTLHAGYELFSVHDSR